MIMNNFDDLNFLCPRCGDIHYRKAPSRERYLEERGAKRCPVCGRIGVQNNGGYVCLKCSQKYVFHESRREIRLHSVVPRRELPLYVRMAIVGFIIYILIGSAMEITVAEPIGAVDVDFRYDERFSAVAEPINLVNATKNQTNIGVWETEFGDDMPNGTFYGSFWVPSLFQHHFKPSYKIFNGTSWYGRFTYTMLATHINFSTEIIMSGVSQYWLRLPVHPSCVDGYVFLCIFNDATNASLLDFEREYDAQNYIMHPEYNNKVPDQFLIFDIDSNVGIGKKTNEFYYLQVNGIIKPSRDYVIAAMFKMKKDSRLKTYWCDNESPYGKFSSIYVAETYQDEDAEPDITVEDVQRVDVELDLDWNFIFVEGIGKEGLFGKKMNFKEGQTLILYPFFNTSRTGSEYMSFVLPFISNEDINVSVMVSQAFSPGIGHVWRFDDSAYQFQPSYCYTYNDFIIFSTNSTVDYVEFEDDDRWNVQVWFTFNYECNLTLLCFESGRPKLEWSEISDDDFLANSSKSPILRPTIYSDDYSESYFLYYDVWISARPTDGQWAYVTMSPSGKSIYTYHFPQEIHLSSQYFEIRKDNSTNSVNVTKTWWDVAKEAWKSGEFIRAIYLTIKGAIQEIWDGSLEFIGNIGSFITKTWEKMKSIGSWVVAKVKEFVGKIWDFLQEAWDTIVHFWDSAKYLAAPLLMMSIMVLGAKGTRMVLKPREG